MIVQRFQSYFSVTLSSLWTATELPSLPVESPAQHNMALPIYKLAPELLQAIFEEAHRDAESFHQHHLNTNLPPAEWTLSHVSRRWRKVALCTPSIWSRVSLGGSSGTTVMALVSLERSQNQLLDVSFTERPNQRPLLGDFSAHILPHINRWRSLSVTTKDAKFWTGFIELVRDASAPELQSLRLDSFRVHENYRPQRKPQSIFIGGAPKLKSLTMRGAALPCIAIGFPELNVVHIHRSGPRYLVDSYKELQIMLNRLPRLSHLILHGGTFADVDPKGMHREVLELPALKNFEFHSRTLVDMCTILEHLTAPLLERVVMRTRDTDYLLEGLRRVPKGHFSSVRYFTFTVHNPVIAPDVWQCVATLFPDIIELTLEHNEIIHFINWSFTHPESDIIWPRLQTLTIMSSGSSDHTEWDIENLATWISSRAARGSSILALKWPIRLAEVHRSALTKLGAVTEVSIWDAESELHEFCEWYGDADHFKVV